MKTILLITLLAFSESSFSDGIYFDKGKILPIIINSENGKATQMDQQYIRVTVPLPSAKIWRYDVRIVFDRKNQIFWWDLVNLGEYFFEKNWRCG